jgi:N-acyl-D-amino-acid deacylase
VNGLSKQLIFRRPAFTMNRPPTMRKRGTIRILLAGALIGSAILWGAPAPRPESWVIQGALVADGRGGPLRRANVRIAGDSIVEVGTFTPKQGERIVEAEGGALAPGFIDIHNHSTEGLLVEPLAATQVSQGITTLVVGADGHSPWPVRSYRNRLRQSPTAVNVMILVGHATIREQVMGEDYRRAARKEEIARMEQLVEQAMQEGAVGLSSGLEYEVGSFATTEELIALARVVARRGGFYMTHIRDEADRVFEALAEALAIGQAAQVPVQISHLKLGTVGVWGQAARAVELIEQARQRGIDVTADSYPYDAWSSTITVLVPNRRHDHAPSVAQGLTDVGGAQNVMIVRMARHPEYEFRTLAEIAEARGISPVELYMEIVREGGASVVCRSMAEEDIRTFYQQPWVMVASDGGIGLRHPRSSGTFPKVLGRYVREQGWLRLEEAVRKMTSLPAARLKLADRGRIQAGGKADLVLFDPETITDHSTFFDPHRLSEGVQRVWVNGVEVWRAEQGTVGAPTGARPGRVLTPVRPPRPD